jgi:hypothetical protein
MRLYVQRINNVVQQGQNQTKSRSLAGEGMWLFALLCILRNAKNQISK